MSAVLEVESPIAGAEEPRFPKPTLLGRETMAMEALQAALGIVIEAANAPDEAGLHYVIDTNRAEPEVNHPGELVAGPVELDVAIAYRRQAAARAILDFVDRGCLA